MQTNHFGIEIWGPYLKEFYTADENIILKNKEQKALGIYNIPNELLCNHKLIKELTTSIPNDWHKS